MKTVRRLFTILSVILGIVLFNSLFSKAGINEWTTLGPPGTWVNSITIDPQDPDIIYLGTTNNELGIYKSTDGGLHWKKKNRGLTCLSIFNIVINPYNPNILYTGTHTGGVFKSTNGGGSWVSKNQGLPPGCWGTQVQYLAMDSEDPDRLYAAHDCFGFYLSTDGGDSWMMIREPEGPCYYRVIAIHPTNSDILYIGTGFSSMFHQGGMYKSTDRARTWTEMISGMCNLLTIFDIAIDPARPETLYASGLSLGEHYSVYKSIDGARNWVCINNNMKTNETRAIVLDPINPDILYAGSLPGFDAQGGVHKSTDGGRSWTLKMTGLISDGIFSLAIDPFRSDIVYAGSRFGGIFKTTDGGENWVDLTDSTMNANWVLNLTIHPENSSIMYASVYRGLFKTTDKGNSWNKVEGGLPEYFAPRKLVIDPKDTRRMYLGTDNYTGMFRSIDGGETWVESNAGLGPPGYIIPIVIHPDSSNVIFIGTWGDGIFRSDDYGGTWHFWVNDFRGKIVWSIIIHPDNPDIIFVSTDEAVYKSTDGGRKWTEKMEGLFGDHYQLTMDPNNVDILWVYNYYWSPDGGVFRSTDGGESWVKKDRGLLRAGFEERTVYTLIIDPEDSNILYCSEIGDCYFRDRMGVYMSTDGGENWESIATEAVEHSCIYDLKFDPDDHNTIYAATKGASVVTYTRVETSVDNPFPTQEVPQEYALFQNCPNPFNPTTSIQYSVVSDQTLPHVSLKIYNILGQEVRTLVDDVKEPGHYKVIWDGRDNRGRELSSGVYFYRLTAGEFSATKGMVLMK